MSEEVLNLNFTWKTRETPLKLLDDLHISWGPDLENLIVPKVSTTIAEFYQGKKGEYHILYARCPLFLPENEVIETLIHELEHYYLTKVLKNLGISTWRHGLYPEWITSEPSFHRKERVRMYGSCHMVML